MGGSSPRDVGAEGRHAGQHLRAETRLCAVRSRLGPLCCTLAQQRGTVMQRVDEDRSGRYDQVGAQLGHEFRVVASAVSHVFLACADLLQLYKTGLELSGRIARLGGTVFLPPGS